MKRILCYCYGNTEMINGKCIHCRGVALNQKEILEHDEMDRLGGNEKEILRRALTLLVLLAFTQIPLQVPAPTPIPVCINVACMS
jgi:hypothetical protein